MEYITCFVSRTCAAVQRPLARTRSTDTDTTATSWSSTTSRSRWLWLEFSEDVVMCVFFLNSLTWECTECCLHSSGSQVTRVLSLCQPQQRWKWLKTIFSLPWTIQETLCADLQWFSFHQILITTTHVWSMGVHSVYCIYLCRLPFGGKISKEADWDFNEGASC